KKTEPIKATPSSSLPFLNTFNKAFPIESIALLDFNILNNRYDNNTNIPIFPTLLPKPSDIFPKVSVFKIIEEAIPNNRMLIIEFFFLINKRYVKKINAKAITTITLLTLSILAYKYIPPFYIFIYFLLLLNLYLYHLLYFFLLLLVYQ